MSHRPQRPGAGGGPPRSRRALLPGPEPNDLHGADINRRPGSDRPSNVIIARVNDIRYPVTLDALYTIFSVYGTIDKIVTFDKGQGFQVLVQYQGTGPASAAFDALDVQALHAALHAHAAALGDATAAGQKAEVRLTAARSAAAAADSGSRRSSSGLRASWVRRSRSRACLLAVHRPLGGRARSGPKPRPPGPLE